MSRDLTTGVQCMHCHELALAHTKKREYPWGLAAVNGSTINRAEFVSNNWKLTVICQCSGDFVWTVEE